MAGHEVGAQRTFVLFFLPSEFIFVHFKVGRWMDGWVDDGWTDGWLDDDCFAFISAQPVQEQAIKKVAESASGTRNFFFFAGN